MNRREKGTLLWVVAIGALAGCLVLLVTLGGCASSPVRPAFAAKVATCGEVIDRALDISHTCQEAEAAINADEGCHRLFPRGFTLRCSGAK